VICAAGTPVGDLQKLWDAANNRKLHLEFGNSCMGYDIPAAIGVRMAQSEGEIYVLLGDGNYMLHPMELVTAAQERTKITIILSENGGYQSIHGHQKALVGHSLGNEFRVRDLQSGLLDEGDFVHVDFAKNAESMGACAWVARTADELRAALAGARQETRSCLIVVPTDPNIGLPGSAIWWDVFGAEVTNDTTTEALVLAREAGRKDQRYYW
jgi:3D-(3,5/4)-trihydroxycyclohexane-1,2-dione acylhydrolase (decyclizing)